MKRFMTMVALAALTVGVVVGSAEAFYAGVGTPYPISAELGLGDAESERDCLVPDPVGALFDPDGGIEKNCLASTSPSANPFRLAGGAIDATYDALTGWAR